MPSSISKATRYRRKEDGYETDNDDKKDDAQPPKKRRKGARKGCSRAMQRPKQDSDHSITIEGYSSRWEGLSEFENLFDENSSDEDWMP